MDIAVIGSGRVGTAMAVLLSRAGHRIVAVSGRGTTAERVARHLPGVQMLLASDANATLSDDGVVLGPHSVAIIG